MVKQAAAAALPTTELDPIDRLEEKVKRLVDVIAQLRAEQARSADEHARLAEEIASLRARLADADAAGGELTALRQERDIVRARVAEMLEQLEAI
jgi:regulator of replication initiation timing